MIRNYNQLNHWEKEIRFYDLPMFVNCRVAAKNFIIQDEEERPRPDFAAKAPYLEKNPITGIREPSFPKAIRLRRIAAGSGLILLMVCKTYFFVILALNTNYYYSLSVDCC